MRRFTRRGRVAIALPEMLVCIGIMGVIGSMSGLYYAEAIRLRGARERYRNRLRSAEFALEPRDPILYYLQRLRDEAHRFAIGTHRARRKTAQGKSLLDGVPGVGAARKRAYCGISVLPKL